MDKTYTIKDGQYFANGSPQWLENYIALRRLAFERAMDRWDIDAANIACAQIEWAEGVLKKTKP